jgi:hypothetical protein
MTSPVVDWSLLDPYVLAAIIALHGTLAVLFRLVYGSRLAPSLAQAPGQASRTLLADMLAYDSVAVCYAIFTLYVGATSWFGWCDPADAASAVGGSMHDRLYGRSERFMLLGVATACYEAYNVVVVVACIPEYRTPIHLTHHATTCFLALFGGYPFLQYYGFFFFGLANASSVPLCLGEALGALGFSTAALLCQVLFAVAFLVVRTIYWPLVSYGFWQDCLAYLRAGDAHSSATVSFFLAANVILTGMQALWTHAVLRGVGEALGLIKPAGAGDQSKKEL